MNLATDHDVDFAKLPIAAADPLTSVDGDFELLAMVFESSTDRIFVKDTLGRYLMANAAVTEFFQRPLADIIGKTDTELLPDDRAKVFARTDNEVLTTGRSVHYEVNTTDGGQPICLYTTKSPIRDRAGNIIGLIGIGRDITTRKYTEEALRLSETRLAAAQRIAHLGSWEWNLKTNEVVWSEECYRIFEINPTTFQPRYGTVLRFLHPSNLERVNAALSAAAKFGLSFKDDFRIVRPSGEERYIHMEGVVTAFDDNDSPSIMTGTIYDLTERKQTELALRQNEANFARAQRIAQVGSWEWVPSTGRHTWSAEALRIFGLPSDYRRPLLQADFVRFVHPDDHVAVAAAIDAALTREVPFDQTFRIIRPDGVERTIYSLGESHRDDDNVSVMTGVCQDITDKQRLHDQLTRSEGNLAQAQRIARMASWSWDMRTGKAVWSDHIHEILEIDPTESGMTVRRLLEFVHTDDKTKVTAAFNPTLAGAAPHAVEFRVIANSGRERFIQSLGDTVHAADGTGTSVIGILQDITERKAIEAELASSRDELRELTNHLQHLQEDERRRIAREIHDEFGAVFTAANLSLYRLASLLQSAPAATLELVKSTKDMLANAGKALDDIVNGLHPQMLSHLGLVATVQWYIDEFQRRTGIRCVRSLPSEALPIADDHALTLFRCLQESLTNIAKHAAASRVQIDFDVTNTHVHLTVTDDGRGVKPDNLVAADVFGIRGLQERVAQHGGTMRLQAVQPRGTRVSVTLPKPQ